MRPNPNNPLAGPTPFPREIAARYSFWSQPATWAPETPLRSSGPSPLSGPPSQQPSSVPHRRASPHGCTSQRPRGREVGLTRRCSGLATLATELHIVRRCLNDAADTVPCAHRFFPATSFVPAALSRLLALGASASPPPGEHLLGLSTPRLYNRSGRLLPAHVSSSRCRIASRVRIAQRSGAATRHRVVFRALERGPAKAPCGVLLVLQAVRPHRLTRRCSGLGALATGIRSGISSRPGSLVSSRQRPAAELHIVRRRNPT